MCVPLPCPKVLISFLLNQDLLFSMKRFVDPGSILVKRPYCISNEFTELDEMC